MRDTSVEPRSLHNSGVSDFSRFSIPDQSNASEADNNFEVNCKQRSRRRSSNADGQLQDRATVPGRWSRACRAGDSSPVTPDPVGRRSIASSHVSPLNTASSRARASNHQAQAQHPQQADPSTTNGTEEHHDPVPSTFDFPPGEYTRPRSQDFRQRAHGRQSASTLGSIELRVPETPPGNSHVSEIVIEDSDQELNPSSVKTHARVVGKGEGSDDVFGPEVAREKDMETDESVERRKGSKGRGQGRRRN